MPAQGWDNLDDHTDLPLQWPVQQNHFQSRRIYKCVAI